MSQTFKERIEDCIYKYPQSLLSFKHQPLIHDIVKDYLPYSTGFEIECSWKETKHNKQENDFKDILNIVDVNCDGNEQRYRIPNGINGLICLEEISKLLKINSKLNPLSGIHYHVDMTDCFTLVNQKFVDINRDWILKELDTWNYKGTYNNRNVSIGGSCWLRFSSEHKTAEFRCGEMTFEYEELVKCIISTNSIVKRLKEQLNHGNPELTKLQNQLKELEEKEEESEINTQIINQRVIKLK